jgi:hypothetical protein
MFDRPKTVALRWGRDGVVTEWNPTFAGVALDLGIGVEVCWPYRPQDRREREVLAHLIEENRVLRRQVGGRRLRLTHDDRRKLAARAYRGAIRLREVVTIVTPDTLLRWHRQLIARKWTYARQGTTRRGVLTEIRQLIRRMAEENPRWGYTRIQGALENLAHRVRRSTIARILRVAAIPPAPQRPTSWQTFLRAHWGEIAAADFFTTLLILAGIPL